MINVDRFVPFIVKHQLKENQFLLLFLLYLKRFDLIRLYKTAFPNENKGMIPKEDKDDLIERGFIDQLVDEDTGEVSWEINDKFLSAFIDEYQAVEELIELYPAFLTDLSTGKRFPIGFIDTTDAKEIYSKKINFSLEEHREVIKDVRFARDNDMIRSGIDKFLSSAAWKKIRPLRLAHEKGELDGASRFKF